MTNKKRNFIFTILAITIGIASFLAIYGFYTLDVTNDRWILQGYNENDILQHYSGWLFYRNSEWSFPIGFLNNMAVGDGVYLSYTDCNPWLAFILKLFSNLLPSTFQYFGWYTLLCFVLQTYAAYKIIKLKTDNNLYSLIGCCFFAFSPILIERAFRHTTLGSQWFILFSIYIFMLHRRKYELKNYLFYLLLMVLAIGIHPYFLPMIGVFILLSVIDDLRQKRYFAIVYLFGILTITYLFGIILGAISNGVSSSRDGFGFYSMNLNSIINPSSLGGYVWSSFIKEFPQVLGNYDGFNYLGIGILIGIVICLVLIFINEKKNDLIQTIKRNIFVIILMAFMTLFAISNVITAHGHILLSIPLPQVINNLCGIFRASSRMFYPVYYLIFISIIIIIWKYVSPLDKKKAIIILSALLLIQIYDIHDCIIEKHEEMNNKSNQTIILDNECVQYIFENGEDLSLDEYNGGEEYLFSTIAGKYNLRTYFPVTNAGDYPNSYTTMCKIASSAKSSGNIGKHIILTSDIDTLSEYLKHENIGYYEYNNTYIIAEDCNNVLEHTIIN